MENSSQTNNIEYIEGKKTVLFPFAMADMEFFIKLCRENEDKIFVLESKKFNDEQLANAVVGLIQNNLLGIWTVMTKQGKGTRKMGFLYITDYTGWKLNVHGLLSKQFLKDIARELLDRYTYTEDAYHAFLGHCFNGAGIERVESFVLRDNRPAIAINRKMGFEIEGMLKKMIKVGNEYKDVMAMAVFREDYNKKNQLPKGEQLAEVK